MSIARLSSMIRGLSPVPEDFFKENQDLIKGIAIGIFAIYALSKGYQIGNLPREKKPESFSKEINDLKGNNLDNRNKIIGLAAKIHIAHLNVSKEFDQLATENRLSLAQSNSSYLFELNLRLINSMNDYNEQMEGVNNLVENRENCIAFLEKLNDHHLKLVEARNRLNRLNNIERICSCTIM